MKLVKYLGQMACVLLEAEPFNKWNVERMLDEDSDPPLLGYSFKECGIQFNCDSEDDRIRSIFLKNDERSGHVLSEISFDLRRDDILSKFGNPSKSGGKIYHPILGQFGAWDRFQAYGCTIHIQYSANEDRIETITYMRNDVAP